MTCHSRFPGCSAWSKTPTPLTSSLVMEDLAHLDQLDQIRGASLEQARSVIRQIAPFHAQWCSHPDLAQVDDVFVPLASPAQAAALPTVFEGAWEACKQFGGESLTPEIQAFGDRWGAHLPRLLDQLATFPTLVHGDFRADNMMFDDHGGLALIDFQIIGIANGLYDIAYFMCQSIDSAVRSGHDRELVELYVDTIGASGIEMTSEDAWSVYQAGVAFCLIKAVTVFRGWETFDGRQRQLMTTMLERTVRAIQDADALAVLSG